MIAYAKEDLVLLPHQGYCNDNFSLKQDGKCYLVREFRLAERDRKQEFAIQKKAAQEGIAPLPLQLSKTVMITEFSEGKHYKKLSAKQIRSLALAVRRLHKTPFRTKREKIPRGLKAPKMLVKLRHSKTDFVLSHNDLNTKNILFADKVQLIDWEYAGVFDRYFDLATVCEEFGFSKKQEAYFMRCYGRKAYHDKLSLYKEVYRRFNKLWFKKHFKMK